MVIVWLVVGLVILVWGAELLVKGASRLAAAFGIAPVRSPLLTGRIVVKELMIFALPENIYCFSKTMVTWKKQME